MKTAVKTFLTITLLTIIVFGCFYATQPRMSLVASKEENDLEKGTKLLNAGEEKDNFMTLFFKWWRLEKEKERLKGLKKEQEKLLKESKQQNKKLKINIGLKEDDPKFTDVFNALIIENSLKNLDSKLTKVNENSKKTKTLILKKESDANKTVALEKENKDLKSQLSKNPKQEVEIIKEVEVVKEIIKYKDKFIYDSKSLMILKILVTLVGGMILGGLISAVFIFILRYRKGKKQ